ncbi:MAG: hypothetical protein COA45_03410 [Zetaproteobacteria bacterium]|nr:MAG: hypothetical protein COA45_03410 [Zetaproteobacteria bacterium]
MLHRREHILKRSILFFGTLMLGACNPIYTGGGEPLAQMTFDHVRVYPIYVASYEPVALMHSEVSDLPEGFVSDPADLLHDYLISRFEASGSQGKLRVVVHDVSVKHDLLRSKNKLGAALNVANLDHYIIRVSITIQNFGTIERKSQSITLTAQRSLYISEYSSLVERERVQMMSLDKLIDDIDISMRAVLKDQLNLL